MESETGNKEAKKHMNRRFESGKVLSGERGAAETGKVALRSGRACRSPRVSPELRQDRWREGEVEGSA